MRLSGLFIYPVKSLRGCAVSAANVDALGLAGDRRFLIVDAGGRFLTQRTLPRMALIATELAPDGLVLSCPGHGRLLVQPVTPGTATRRVSIWRSEGLLANDCGDEAADWLAEVLQTECRLVAIGEQFRRPVLKPAARPGDLLHFADACPFLLVSEASLDDLNDRLIARGEEAVPMDRFRPNLVVTGCSAFAEDGWTRFTIGPIAFRSAGPCVRCVVATTDQQTATRGPEPLRTLATYRRAPDDPAGVIFGQNLIHETTSGPLRVGDQIVPTTHMP